MSCIAETRNFSEDENVNTIIRSREADEFEQVEYLRSSVVRKLSKV